VASLGVLVAADRHTAIIFRVGGQLWSTAWDSQGGASWNSKTLAGYQGFPKAGFHDDEPDGIWDFTFRAVEARGGSWLQDSVLWEARICWFMPSG